MAAFFVSAAQAQQTAIFDRIDEIVVSLGEITGFEKRKTVEHSTITRDKLKAFLEERIQQEIKPEDIRIEELLLKKFGLVPQDFDLKDTTIALYTEQAAAFYDFKKKRLFLLDGNNTVLEEAALIHELAHALADQHFKLRRFLENAGKNDDGALARMAVMEGQATWLMAEFTMRNAGGSLLDTPEMINVMSRMVSSSAGQFPVLDSVPHYVRESLIFPYNSGMKFQNAVIVKYGDSGFARVFRNPPTTTREVLHPEVYLAGEKVDALKAPRLVREKQYKTLAEGTVGEFDYAVLLREYADEETIRRIAPNWRAAKYRFLEHKKDKHTILTQTSQWADDATARELFLRYRDILEAKWKSFEITDETATRITGRGDDGHFLLLLSGRRVYSFEGLQSLGQARVPAKP